MFGRPAISSSSDAETGVDGVYLVISGEAVVLRCDTHPEFTASCAYGDGERVLARWVVDAFIGHIKDHAPASDCGIADEPIRPATAAVSPLDEFGRTVAVLCRWAMDHNDGDPHEGWATGEQLAVALVLGNHLYLQDMGPGPGYTPEQAVFRLVSGMTHRPPSMDSWIAAIRDEIRQPGDSARGGLLLPHADLRVERRPES